jgi:hypothetical protein
MADSDRIRQEPAKAPDGRPRVVPPGLVRLGADGLVELGPVEQAVRALTEHLEFAEADPRRVISAVALRLAEVVDRRGSAAAAAQLSTCITHLTDAPASELGGSLDDVRMRHHTRRLEQILGHVRRLGDVVSVLVVGTGCGSRRGSGRRPWLRRATGRSIGDCVPRWRRRSRLVTRPAHAVAAGSPQGRTGTSTTVMTTGRSTSGQVTRGAIGRPSCISATRRGSCRGRGERESSSDGHCWTVLSSNRARDDVRTIGKHRGPCVGTETAQKSTRTSRDEKRTSKRSITAWTSLRANCSSKRSGQGLIDRNPCLSSSRPSGKPEDGPKRIFDRGTCQNDHDPRSMRFAGVVVRQVLEETTGYGVVPPIIGGFSRGLREVGR